MRAADTVATWLARATARARRARTDSWARRAPSPWRAPTAAETGSRAWCPICRWTGEAFGGSAHSERAICPRCGSIARDRFLFWCYVTRNGEPAQRQRVLETSPRLGEAYRGAMAQWFDYRSSDFDERAHRGAVRLDLQHIELPDCSVDVLLTPHVLEHVPDTARALGEIRRILAPGGVMYLQVPVLQAVTAPPTSPEFHGDDTPVFWRFGYDLTDTLRDAGFETAALVTEPFLDAARTGRAPWTDATAVAAPEFDVAGLLAGARLRAGAELVAVADEVQAARIGAEPAFMFITWECRKAP